MSSRQAKWQRKQLALGLCRLCPQPLAPGSRSFCQTHLDRARARIGTILPHADRRAIWDSVDWSKSSSEIAAATGYTKGYVSIMRRRLAPETLRIAANRQGSGRSGSSSGRRAASSSAPRSGTKSGSPAKGESDRPRDDYLHFLVRQKRRRPRKRADD